MNFDSLLGHVVKPSRYCGNEFNGAARPWEQAELRFVLAFPDLYEIGMSHQGLQILYHLLNARPEFLADRVYAPAPDMENLLRSAGQPLFSVELKRPLAQFDVLGITLPYELCYSNILTMLDLARIPFRAAARDEKQPLIIGGGPCAFHPEPVADFFDAILLGDGEEAVIEMADCILAAKRNRMPRQELLEALRQIQGVYVPAFFRPCFEQDRFVAMEPLRPGYERVKKRILPDLDTVDVAFPPLVPAARIVHDRLAVEIARGCTRGCRFCQAGSIYRPVRERTPARVLEMASQGIAQGGFEDLALLSLSTGDYTCLAPLLVSLMDRFSREHVSVSMPSMRVGTLTPEIMTQIRRVKKTGFTLAPEAGTERLRQVINKGITEADLLATCKTAFELGWKLLKFYFMFGLPTETREDLEAIPALVRRALPSGPGGRRINVSVAAFVPKPHTPFQWARQLSVQESFANIDYLKEQFKGQRFQLKWNDPRQSFLEGVLSRGDRRLSRLIEVAWGLGVRLDGWSEYFQSGIWDRAALECGIDLTSYLLPRELASPLPWAHLDAGLDPDFFKEELDKALHERYTPDCRRHGCQKCGLCDFKTVKPIVHSDCHLPRENGEASTAKTDAAANSGRPFLYLLHYSILGPARFFGHLEMMQVFFRAFRRLQMPLIFSQGFNPTPKITFSPALPLGTESKAEYMMLEMKAPLADLDGMRQKLNSQLPEGLKVETMGLAGAKSEGAVESCYLITLERRPPVPALQSFLDASAFPIRVERKKQIRQLDVRPLVGELSVTEDGAINLVLRSEPSRAGAKPLEILAAVLGLSAEEIGNAQVLKLWYREI